MGRKLRMRLKEHGYAVKRDENDGIVHAQESGHGVNQSQYEEHITKREVLKSTLILKSSNTNNLDAGLSLIPIWKPFLKAHHADSHEDIPTNILSTTPCHLYFHSQDSNFHHCHHNYTKIIVVRPSISNGQQKRFSLEARTRQYLWTAVMELAMGTITSLLDRLYKNRTLTCSGLHLANQLDSREDIVTVTVTKIVKSVSGVLPSHVSQRKWWGN